MSVCSKCDQPAKPRKKGGFYHLCEEHWAEYIRPRCRELMRSRPTPREVSRRYFASAKGKAMMRKTSATRRARKLDQFIEEVDPTIVYQMHGGMCSICKEFVAEDDFHVDHVIPLAKGGMHGYINVQPAHSKCNLQKGAYA